MKAPTKAPPLLSQLIRDSVSFILPGHCRLNDASRGRGLDQDRECRRTAQVYMEQSEREGQRRRRGHRVPAVRSIRANFLASSLAPHKSRHEALGHDMGTLRNHPQSQSPLSELQANAPVSDNRHLLSMQVCITTGWSRSQIHGVWLFTIVYRRPYLSEETLVFQNAPGRRPGSDLFDHPSRKGHLGRSRMSVE